MPQPTTTTTLPPRPITFTCRYANIERTYESQLQQQAAAVKALQAQLAQDQPGGGIQQQQQQRIAELEEQVCGYCERVTRVLLLVHLVGPDPGNQHTHRLTLSDVRMYVTGFCGRDMHLCGNTLGTSTGWLTLLSMPTPQVVNLQSALNSYQQAPPAAAAAASDQSAATAAAAAVAAAQARVAALTAELDQQQAQHQDSLRGLQQQYEALRERLGAMVMLDTMCKTVTPRMQVPCSSVTPLSGQHVSLPVSACTPQGLLCGAVCCRRVQVHVSG
jgi:hypothetical protein